MHCLIQQVSRMCVIWRKAAPWGLESEPITPPKKLFCRHLCGKVGVCMHPSISFQIIRQTHLSRQIKRGGKYVWGEFFRDRCRKREGEGGGNHSYWSRERRGGGFAKCWCAPTHKKHVWLFRLFYGRFCIPRTLFAATTVMQINATTRVHGVC